MRLPLFCCFGVGRSPTTCTLAKLQEQQSPNGQGERPPFFNFDFELKGSTYTLPAETLCRKLEKQGGMFAFLCFYVLGVNTTISTVSKFRGNSLKFRWIFGIFWGGTPLREVRDRQWEPTAAQRRFCDDSLTLRVVAVDPNLPLPCREHPYCCWLVLGKSRASSPIAPSALSVFGRSDGAALRAAFGGGQRFALPCGAFGAPFRSSLR